MFPEDGGLRCGDPEIHHQQVSFIGAGEEGLPAEAVTKESAAEREHPPGEAARDGRSDSADAGALVLTSVLFFASPDQGQGGVRQLCGRVQLLKICIQVQRQEGAKNFLFSLNVSGLSRLLTSDPLIFLTEEQPSGRRSTQRQAGRHPAAGLHQTL